MLNAYALATSTWRPSNGKAAVNAEETILCITLCFSHPCQPLHRCSAQTIPRNICATSPTCCKPQNASLQDLLINLRPCVENTKPSKWYCITEKKKKNGRDQRQRKEQTIPNSCLMLSMWTATGFSKCIAMALSSQRCFLFPWSSRLTSAFSDPSSELLEHQLLGGCFSNSLKSDFLWAVYYPLRFMMFHSDRLCEIIIIKKVSNKTWTKTKKRRVLKKIRTRVILPLFYFFFSYTFGINVRINSTQHCEKQSLVFNISNFRHEGSCERIWL